MTRFIQQQIPPLATRSVPLAACRVCGGTVYRKRRETPPAAKEMPSAATLRPTLPAEDGSGKKKKAKAKVKNKQ